LRRANGNGDRLCPSVLGGKNWEPSAYNPELGLLFVTAKEGCNYIVTKQAP
jgi:alcohol dehydrogenase (cytochrome c)